MIGEYINGNYKVTIYEDGTKIRETLNPDDNYFSSEFPECIDLKITNRCDLNCPYCHENSSPEGKHSVLLQNFIDTLKPFTELAIGGGNPLSHPDLIPFLELLKERNIIANITINQIHFKEYCNLINWMSSNGLIKGLGVSLVNPNDIIFTKLIKCFPNLVLHVINGVHEYKDLEKLFNQNIKLLILGYKQFRKGKDFYSPRVERIKQTNKLNIQNILKGFKIVSFDNLAIEQLDIKSLLTNDEWNEFYMGDDGQFTMYIDLVEQKFARSSISNLSFDLESDITDMFKKVKEQT